MKPCKQWPTLLFSGLTIAAVALVPVHAADAPPRAGAICDRACLKGFVDRYLDALVAHDRGRLPLTKDARFMFTIKSAHAAIPIAELFKVKNGRLYEIEAAGVMGTGLPDGARSGW
jgi:hypothetical protein